MLFFQCAAFSLRAVIERRWRCSDGNEQYTTDYFIIIIIIDKTDAGLNGLSIQDITYLCDVINMHNNY